TVFLPSFHPSSFLSHYHHSSTSLLVLIYFLFLILRRPHWSTLFPYTTLFRSIREFSTIRWCLRAGDAAVVLRDEECRQADCSGRSEEHTSELQSRFDLVCRLLLEKKKK